MHDALIIHPALFTVQWTAAEIPKDMCTNTPLVFVTVTRIRTNNVTKKGNPPALNYFSFFEKPFYPFFFYIKQKTKIHVYILNFAGRKGGRKNESDDLVLTP